MVGDHENRLFSYLNVDVGSCLWLIDDARSLWSGDKCGLLFIMNGSPQTPCKEVEISLGILLECLIMSSIQPQFMSSCSTKSVTIGY